jgi:hypothetical protein
MPALGSTTSVWQTGRVLPTKAFQVSDNQFSAVGSSTESKIYVRVFNYVKSVVSTFIKLWPKLFMTMKVQIERLCPA